jgi:uncharacterized protein (TIGR01777 family)
MIVAVSGSTGFIGQTLVRKLRQKEFTVRIISRDSFSLSGNEFLSSAIEGADVVINLAGAPVSKRWTPAYKLEIRASRVNTTQKISAAIRNSNKKPELFISGSAIGIYDSAGTHTETSRTYADTFLAKVCLEWEAEAANVEDLTRVVIFRTGVVLGKNGGALQKMIKPFSLGVGGKLGPGNQPFSFIHIDDLVRALIFTIENSGIRGIVNAVSPFPSTNMEFTDILGKVLRQPTWLTVPSFALKMMFGEGAEVLLEGQRVFPEKLEKEGFRFQFPTIRNALVGIFS